MKPEKKEKLLQALAKSRYYSQKDYFEKEPLFVREPKNSKYEYKIILAKWRKTAVVVVFLLARYDPLKNEYVIAKIKK